MKKNDSLKFNLIASILHGEEIDQEQKSYQISDSEQDFNDAKKIYSLREQIGHLRNLTSEAKVWKQIELRISVKKAIAWQKWLSYAAVFFVAIVLSTAFHLGNKWMTETESFATVISPRGQITSMTLFDGTTVWLNSGSTIKYSNQFGKKQREVTIEGEALLEVHKDKQKSFIVNIGDSRIKVHGTVFNVKNYPTEKEVVLIKGEIEYNRQGETFIMKPNDRVTENINTGKISIDQVDASIYSSWIGGKIFFDTESLDDLSLRLERWYDVAFVFENEKIKSYKFTGVINKDKSLDYTLKIIQLTNKVKFRKERDKIIITE